METAMVSQLCMQSGHSFLALDSERSPDLILSVRDPESEPLNGDQMKSYRRTNPGGPFAAPTSD